MTVSVVIPTWNGRDHLARCLASLKVQTMAPTELLIVDNGSTDGTVEWVAAHVPTARLVRSPVNTGFAGGVNRGAGEASGEFLWILNDDVVVEPDGLQALAAVMARRPECAACSSKILRWGFDGPAVPTRYDAVGDYLTWTGFLYHLGYGEEDRGQYDAIRELFSPKGVSILVRRAVFERLGRLDERFGSYFEESDFFWRCWLAGLPVAFAPASRVWHMGGGTSRRLASATIDYYAFRNRAWTLMTHLGALRLLVILPIHLACCLGISAAYLVRGRFRNAWAVVAAVGAAIAALPALLAKRRHVQKTLRTVSDRRLFAQHARPLTIGWSWRFLQTYLRRW